MAFTLLPTYSPPLGKELGKVWGRAEGGRGLSHLIAGVQCPITEARDHVLHQSGAPTGEKAVSTHTSTDALPLTQSQDEKVHATLPLLKGSLAGSLLPSLLCF